MTVTWERLFTLAHNCLYVEPSTPVRDTFIDELLTLHIRLYSLWCQGSYKRCAGYQHKMNLEWFKLDGVG